MSLSSVCNLYKRGATGVHGLVRHHRPRRAPSGRGSRSSSSGRGLDGPDALVVGEAVPPQVAVPPEDLAAVWTVERFDVGVRQEVGLEVAPLVEGSAACGALVGRLLHVEGLVDGQGSRLAEAFTALSAFKGFLLGMDVPGIGRTMKKKIHKETVDLSLS